MSDAQQRFGLWNEYLTQWPISKADTMTLDEYT